MIDPIVRSNLLDANRLANKALDEGKPPLCHICADPECYTLTIQQDTSGQQYMVRTFLYEPEGALCIRCWTYMHGAGRLVTKVLHMSLRVKIFVEKILRKKTK